MNRHLRGEAHGLPLSALELSSEASGNHGAIYSQDVSARIVEGQLLLRTNTIVRNGPCQAFWVNPPITFCQHRTTSSDRLIPLDSEGIDDDQRNSAISCAECMTDYNTRCSREADGDCIIQITVYQKIHGVRREHRMFEHQDWYWASRENNLRRCKKTTTARIDRFEPVYGLGAVRRMWQGVDGLQPESDGEWGYGLSPFISYSCREPDQLIIDDREEIIRGKRKPRRPREEAFGSGLVPGHA